MPAWLRKYRGVARGGVAAGLAGVLLNAPGCAPEAGPAASAVVERDTLANGAVLVRYARLPVEDAELVAADLRIGSVDGDPATVFGNVRGIDAGRDGTVYVLDYQAAEVRAFDRTGAFLRTVAAEGEGPGEITAANGITLAGDTLLWVQDHGKWVFLGLGTRGEERARIPMHVRGFAYVWNGTVDERGRFWKPTERAADPRPGPPEDGLFDGTAHLHWVSFDPTSGESDTVYVGDARRRSWVTVRETGFSFRGVPFDPAPITVVDPAGGFWTTESSEFRIARLDEAGDTVLVIESTAEAIPVTATDRAEYVRGIEERAPQDLRVAEQIAQLIPITKPVISALSVDDEGRLWIGRTVPVGGRPLYDVFDRDGRYHQSVRLAFEPAPHLPIRVRNGHLYALVLDELDVHYVVRARVRR